MPTRLKAAAAAVFAVSIASRMVQAQQQPGVLGIPMTRMGSGTSWLPDAVPMHAVHFRAGAWALMVHGVVFGMYDKQFGRRGDDQINSVNWGRLMATRSVGQGSLEPVS
jgi:hypothetical protein